MAELSGGLTPAAWLHRLIGLGPDVVAAHCIELTDDDLELVVFHRGGGGPLSPRPT